MAQDSLSKTFPDEIKSKILDEIDSVTKTGIDFRDGITKTSFLLWQNSQVYKQPRMNRVSLFERLYNNNLPSRERQLFNICLPILGGFEDALKANMTDPVQLRFENTRPSDYMTVRKIQKQWEDEKDGLMPHQLWNQKSRVGMHDAMLSGRTIMRLLSENSPVYRSVLDNTYYSNFHNQPQGGVNLENHLFAGEEGIYLTLEDIISNDSFDLKQREKLKKFMYSDEFWQYIEESYGTRFMRYQSLGLNINSNTFAGTRTVFLCMFVVQHRGVRYFNLFEPFSQTWLICEKLKDYTGSDLYPWDSAATHEDSQNFWSKGFSDDIFAIAVTISTLLNQELTNREKSNFHPRAYDPTIFTDPQKLDMSQYFPDRLVPVDTAGGTRKIEEGIYSFDTPQLTGTINLLGWLEQELGKQTGIQDLTQVANQKGATKAQVVLAQQQQIAKRIGFKAEPFKEMWGRLGLRYVSGLKEFMPETLPMQLIGEDGFTEESELKRLEISRSGVIGVKVISSSSQQQENQSKKDAKIQALGMVKDSQNVNAKWKDEQILRDVGEFDEADMTAAFDTQTYGSKKQIARASQAIQDMLKGKMPEVYYAADAGFLKYIQNFSKENHNKVIKFLPMFQAYFKAMIPIVTQNEKAAMQEVARGQKSAAAMADTQNGRNQPGGEAKGNVSKIATT